jgi:membrane protein implicated in regulation of membrane protease activity
MITAMRRRYWLLYPAWIVLCAVLFLALRHRDDPSRRPGRILSDDAGIRALAILHRPDYEAVHVAAEGNRWIVLCDRVPHTGLNEAVVVELDAVDGHLLTIRKPIRR